jgi:hypothetical protein
VEEPKVEPPNETDTHTHQGAPTEQAHQDVRDGSLTGSTPAGVTADELRKQAGGKTDDGGTG